MEIDISTAKFEFKFEGPNAEREAREMFDALPTGKCVKDITNRKFDDKSFWFVSTDWELEATAEYVQAVADVLGRYEIREI